MFRHFRVFGIVFFTAALSLSVLGQSGEVNGEVSDVNGASIAGADVTLRNKQTGHEIKTQTSSSGSFTFTSLSNGAYVVKVDAKGFSFSSLEISIPGNSTDLKVRLSVGNINEKVTVTATRTQIATTDTAVPVSVIDREEVEQKNVNTIGDIFRSLPGASTVNEGAFQVRPRIRGLDSNRVLVLVDGERLNNARSSTSQSGIEPGLVETEQIETLEVVRGSGSVLYGTDALAGTVNIITKDASRKREDGFRFGAVFNGYASSNETGRRGSLALDGSSRFFSFRIAQSLERYGNYFSGDPSGNQIDGVNADGEVLNSQSHGSNTQITTRYFFSDNNDLKLNFERRRAGNIGSPTLVGVFNGYFPYSDRDKFSGRYEIRNINKYLANVSASAYYQKQERNFSNILDVPAAPPFFPGEYQFSETITDTKSTGFDIQSNWILGTKNFLTAGVSLFRDDNSDTRYLEIFTGNYMVFPPVLVRSEDFSPSVPDSQFGSIAFFAQDQLQATERLKLTGGIRAERFNSRSEPTTGFSLPAIITQELTPAEIDGLGLTGFDSGLDVNETTLTGDFGAVFKATENISFTGRIGRSYRVSNLFERFFTGAGSVGGFLVANPNLEPESGINIDTGIKFITAKFAGSVSYFNNTYKNFLSSVQLFDDNGNAFLASSGGLFQTQNIARARIQGVEAEFEMPLKIWNGFLTPNGNITYLRGDNLDTDQPLNTITPLKTFLNLRWQDEANRFYADWSTRIVNKQDRLSVLFLASNGGPEPGFTVSDLGGGYTFRRENYRLSFNVGIKNIFDRYYNEQFVFAPARGRSFVIGTTIEFHNK
ncbi:MAG: TonB-dependent receptor [Pyrinomonadaceae bacterium]